MITSQAEAAKIGQQIAEEIQSQMHSPEDSSNDSCGGSPMSSFVPSSPNPASVIQRQQLAQQMLLQQRNASSCGGRLSPGASPARALVAAAAGQQMGLVMRRRDVDQRETGRSGMGTTSR